MRKPVSKRRKGSNPTRVLVVEDEIFVAWHIESVLTGLHYSVCGLVPDGASAVSQSDSMDVDLVLLDINLKGDIDGIEAARRIRQASDTAIVFVTAYSDPETLARVERTVPGAPVLAKPISPPTLRAAIEQAMHA